MSIHCSKERIPLPGLRIPRRERPAREERRRRGGFNVLWAFFWLILIIILLGLIFGGYRKGSQIKNPGSWVTVGMSVPSGRAQ
jgi:hypothetical protein